MVPGDFIKALQTYLATTLGIAIPALSAWPGMKSLPRYLADGFAFYELKLWEQACLVMVAKQAPPLPVDLQKQLRLVEHQAGLPVIYGQTEMTARQRQRLLDLFLPFVVPSRQLFLPPLGVDLREHYTAQARQHAPTLSPADQAVLLAGLLGIWQDDSHASVMARQFGYSAMTLSRVRRELLDRGFVRMIGAGRGARWALNDSRQAIWHSAQAVLRSPVVRRVWCALPDDERARLPAAGLTALATHTMLAGPAIPVAALSEVGWRELTRRWPGLRTADEAFDGAIELELWSYEPRILLDPAARCVDRYSLFLSLQAESESDARVAQALDAMMRDAET
jgi:hypothetical protein